MGEGDVVIDIEGCCLTTTAGELPRCETPANPAKYNLKPGKNAKREKGFSTGAKKPPKPPRPPRGLSLDAADEKLIREISELAMIKRARIERMKAMKRLKGAKGSVGSASSGGNLIAMVFTVLFCVVVIFQGCHPLRIFPSKSSVISFISSPTPTVAREGNHIIGVTDQRKLSTPSEPGSLSFMDISPVLGLNKNEATNISTE